MITELTQANPAVITPMLILGRIDRIIKYIYVKEIESL